MKKTLFLILMAGMTGVAWAEDAPPSSVQKTFDVPGVFSRSKLDEAIGIETLADAFTVIFDAGAAEPAKVVVKLGVADNTNCAKLKLLRMKPGKAPEEISYDAICGFSADNKTVEATFELARNEKIKITVPVAGELKPGSALEWIPAKDVKVKPVVLDIKKEEPKAEEKQVEAKPEEKTEVKTEKPEVEEKKSEEEKPETKSGEPAQTGVSRNEQNVNVTSWTDKQISQ